MVEEAAKLGWLKERLPAFVDAGEVLVFAAQKARVETVVAELRAAGFRCCKRMCRPGDVGAVLCLLESGAVAGCWLLALQAVGNPGS